VLTYLLTGKNSIARRFPKNSYECTIDQELAYAAAKLRGRRSFSLTKWQHFSARNAVMAAISNYDNTSKI